MNISGNTSLYGVVGYPVKHSLSPLFQNKLFEYVGLNAVYVPFEVKREELKTAFEGLKALNVKGINLTIPHKEAIVDMLDFVHPDAEKIGAVNTVKFGERTEGYNTDWIGFLNSLRETVGELKGKTVLVLGAGGSARAVLYALEKENAKVYLWNRTKEKAKKLSEIFKSETVSSPEEVLDSAHIIVNTTSVGLTEDYLLFDYSLLKEGQVVFELIYGKNTLLKEWSQKRGAVYLDGLKMLVYQGLESFRIWTGCKPNPKVAFQALEKHLK
ncbi:shikimate dehydrogenase [Thermocrinis jamiesonii]|jgi:shikimate dehydrogenase (EC 1.1.1.25)|uniref:shikimate dehydrogenase n=1 Tax=Thermocrinis jamiesonii TaxID=1302351 RepID=UPI00049724CE|nr:shikimate dehydrogenase [Thermocrinis jamiesonii]